MACGIVIPRPGIKPLPFALEAGVLTARLSGKSPLFSLLYKTAGPLAQLLFIIIFLN